MRWTKLRPSAAYSDDLYRAKCAAVYQHVYDSYFGSGGSVYAGG
jgi:hypothetical protein